MRFVCLGRWQRGTGQGDAARGARGRRLRSNARVQSLAQAYLPRCSAAFNLGTPPATWEPNQIDAVHPAPPLPVHPPYRATPHRGAVVSVESSKAHRGRVPLYLRPRSPLNLVNDHEALQRLERRHWLIEQRAGARILIMKIQLVKFDLLGLKATWCRALSGRCCAAATGRFTWNARRISSPSPSR